MNEEEIGILVYLEHGDADPVRSFTILARQFRQPVQSNRALFAVLALKPPFLRRNTLDLMLK